VIFVFVVMMLAACSRSTAADAKPQVAPAAAAPAAGQAAPAAPAPEPPAKPVPPQLPEIIARVNGEVINKTDFENAVKGLEGRAGAPVPGDQRDRVYRGVLDDMISYRLLVQEMKTRKIVVPDSEIDAQVAQIRAQFQTDAQFQQALAMQKTTLAAVRDDARSQIGVENLVESEIGTRTGVKPEAITDFYQKNPGKFQQGARVKASHILISVPENADAATKLQAKTKAEAVLKDLKAGKDFAAAAKLSSQDPGSAPNGGDLGFFEPGQMVPPFEQAAFALKPGEMSGLVESPFGFHIIKVAEKQASRVIPIEEAMPQIEQYLTGQNRQALTEAFVNTLKAKAKIDILM
jgi:peptidyl-prolyl cis-trans isomerase C